MDVEAEEGSDWRCIANQMLAYEELSTEEQSHTCCRGLCVAHMDTHLRANEDAGKFLHGDVLGALAERDIDVVELRYGKES